ncbi:MAG: MBOAT family O-acyltransferase [Acutalibacteraceae bacterium]
MNEAINAVAAFFSSQIAIVSLKFMCFVAVTAVVYFICPKKHRWIVLTAANTVFYVCGGIESVIYILLATLVAYLSAKMFDKDFALQKKECEGLERAEKKAVRELHMKKRKKVLTLSVVLLIFSLAVIKYTGFFLSNINSLLGVTGLGSFETENITKHIPAILGCSYFTLAIIAYITDVYRQKYHAEKNYFKLYLFVSYFPHAVQGPIERYDYLAPLLEKGGSFSFENLKQGAMLILWGFFKKFVIADRLNIVSHEIFSNYENYSGPFVLFGAAVFSIQLYADWTAYCDIVGGASRIFGIEITKNFARPYFSQTMPEFWRRWHISMGAFFKDYVLYPVSTSQFSLKLNKKAREKFGNNAGKNLASAIPILSVWLLTGLWHGASWTFILWGLYQGILIMLSVIFENPLKKLCERFNFKTDTFSWRLFRTLRTFLLCCIGRIFFKAGSVSDIIGLFSRLLTFSLTTKQFTDMGLTVREWAVTLVALIIFLIYSLIEEKYENVEKRLDSQPVPMKWAVLIFIIMFIVIFGVYGSSEQYVAFVYEQF